MKTAKLVIGIFSMVLFMVIVFQSCVAGIGNAIEENGETSGSSGIFLAVFMLIAGIVGVVTRQQIAGGFVAGGFYVAGGLIGITDYGSYGDLLIWSILCFIFGAVFIAGSVVAKRKSKEAPQVNQGEEVSHEKVN